MERGLYITKIYSFSVLLVIEGDYDLVVVEEYRVQEHVDQELPMG